MYTKVRKGEIKMQKFELSDISMLAQNSNFQRQDDSGIATLAQEISEISKNLMAKYQDEISRNQARIRELEAQLAKLQDQIRVISAQNLSLKAQLNLLITSRF